MAATSNKAQAEAVARLSRAYVAFLENPSEDALFNWSNALHSMHDRVPPMRSDLFALDEFVAMKALRNHFHHNDEVPHRFKVIPAHTVPVVSDLPVLCLIDRSAAESAIQGIGERFKVREQPMAERALKWYGSVVNVNPAIFNLMATVVLLAKRHGVVPDDPAYRRLADAVEQDQASGHPISASGDLTCHAASVDEVLRQVMSD